MKKKILVGLLACVTTIAIADPTVFTGLKIEGDAEVTGIATLAAATLTSPIVLGTNAAPFSSVAATGHVAAATAVAIKHGETVTVNDQTYTFWTNTLAAANQVKIAITPTGTDGHTNSVAVSNLFLAITVGGTSNPTLYHTATVKPSNVTATKVDNSTVKFASDAGSHGAIGNAFPLLRAGVADAAGTNLTVTGTGTFIGGTDGTVGVKGTVRLHGTSISFTTMDSTAGHAVWTTK
jgi:hypothetical protein